MFTGIITDTTSVTRHKKTEDGLTVTFKKPEGWDDLKTGESVSTDGVCLTVAKIQNDTYDCNLVPETLDKSTFGRNVPSEVNLERSLRVADRFGGHFVQGHVDGVGKITQINKLNGYHLYVKFPPDNKKLVIRKGSITINGVALTVIDV